MSDLKTFIPKNTTELFNAIKADISDSFGEWWKSNKSVMSGHLKVVAQSALETQKSLIKGHISQELADIAIQAQKAAFRQILRHTKLMTLALLQNIVNTVFRRIGWAIFNKTRVNFFPELVDA